MDLESLKLKQKLEMLAGAKAFGIVKAYRAGGSFAFIIPRIWVDLNCPDVDGERYLKVSVEENRIILSPVELADMEGVSIKRKDDTDDRNRRPGEDNQGSFSDGGDQR